MGLFVSSPDFKHMHDFVSKNKNFRHDFNHVDFTLKFCRNFRSDFGSIESDDPAI